MAATPAPASVRRRANRGCARCLTSTFATMSGPLPVTACGEDAATTPCGTPATALTKDAAQDTAWRRFVKHLEKNFSDCRKALRGNGFVPRSQAGVE